MRKLFAFNVMQHNSARTMQPKGSSVFWEQLHSAMRKIETMRNSREWSMRHFSCALIRQISFYQKRGQEKRDKRKRREKKSSEFLCKQKWKKKHRHTNVNVLQNFRFAWATLRWQLCSWTAAFDGKFWNFCSVSSIQISIFPTINSINKIKHAKFYHLIHRHAYKLIYLPPTITPHRTRD